MERMVQEVKKREEGGGEGERWRQNVSSLSVLCVAVLIGLPLWWKTTEVYRCPLPYEEIRRLSSQQVPPVLLYTVSLLALDDDGLEMVTSLTAGLQRELDNQTVNGGGSELTLSYLVQPLALEPGTREKIKEAIGSDAPPSLTSLLPPSMPGHYTIILVPGHTSSRLTLSTSRWALVHTTTGGGDLDIAETVSVVRSLVIGQQMLRVALDASRGRERGRGRGDKEEMRRLRAAEGYHVAFTLLAPDPSLGRVDWNIEQATKRVLLPFIHHPGIASLANFTISSQVFHYTDLKFTPHKSKSSSSYYIPSTSLPPMISSVESKLGSLVSQLPSLNFLVLVPPATHAPLLIRDPQDQLTNNFLVPQWGGVVFHSPPEWGVRGGGGGEVKVEMEEVMRVFVRHTQLLLGLPQTHTGLELVPEHGNVGIAEWQIDQLLVARMLESISMATTSLVSLVELLDKVKNMVISDVIQHQVEASLSYLHQCYRLAGEGDLGKALSYAKQATTAAETAFFDPSILELLYFPDDQKFAIYIPLFLPISIPIMMSSVTAVRWLASATRKPTHPHSD